MQKNEENAPGSPVRLDKWLWAARFFKTRRLALDAVEGGKIHVGRGELEVKSKAGHHVLPGEIISINREGIVHEVLVLGLSSVRGPASEAAKLFRETDLGKARREAEIERRRLAEVGGPVTKGRPTKTDRRDLDRHLDRGEI
jgi:ribosome-associated heat shock protein Hsp15